MGEIKKYKLDHSLYYNVIDNAELPITIMDKNGFFLFANKASLKNFKFKNVNQIIGKNFKDFFPKKLAIGYINTIKKVINTKKTIRTEDQIIIPQGERWFSAIITPIKNSNGLINSVQIISQDITHEKELKSNTNFYTKVIKNMAEGVYVIGLKDGIIKYANLKFEQMFGYYPGELIGKDVSIINASTKKDPKKIASEIIGFIKKNGEWHGEIQNIKKDGTIFWCYANVSIFKHSKYGEVMIAVHSDISERKKIESELERERKVLNHVIDDNPYSIMITNSQGKSIKVNKAFIKLFKTKPLPNYNIFTDPIIKKAGWQKQNLALKKGVPYSIPEILFNPHNIDKKYPNRSVYMSISAVPIMYKNTLKNVIIMHKDITIENKTQRELKEKINELGRINNLLVGRELKMIELKEKILKLTKK